MLKASRVPRNKGDGDVYDKLMKHPDPATPINFTIDELREAVEKASSYKKVLNRVTSDEDGMATTEYTDFVKSVTGCFLTLMSARGYSSHIESWQSEDVKSGAFRVSLTSTEDNVEVLPYSECLFLFLYISERDKRSRLMVREKTKSVLSHLVFIPPDLSKRVVIICNNAEAFTILDDYKHRLSFEGVLSCICMGRELVKDMMSEIYLKEPPKENWDKWLLFM